MKRIRHILLCCVVLTSIMHTGYAQLATGQWKSHMSYVRGQKLAVSDHKIYCVASGNLFSYGRQDNAIETYSKVNGLSDVYIKEIAFCKPLETLVICYDNGNIDLLSSAGITNVPDLKQKAIYGSKAINGLDIIDKTAYLSADFGVLKINLEKAEIVETYALTYGDQNSVSGVAILEDRLYAATAKGLYSADLNHVNLQNFSAWEKVSGLNDFNLGIEEVTAFANTLVIAQKTENGTAIKYLDGNGSWQLIKDVTYFHEFASNDSELLVACYYYVKIIDANLKEKKHLSRYQFSELSFPSQYQIKSRHAIPLSDNTYCLADNRSTLVIYHTDKPSESYAPDGLGSNEVWAIDINEDIVRVVPGGTTYDINNLWRPATLSTYRDNKWQYLNAFNGGENLFEYVNVLSDPLDKEHFFVASYGLGLLEYQNNTLINRYTEYNSSIENAVPGNYKYVRTYGLAFDKDHNLWVSNSDTETQFHVKTDDNLWYSIKSNLMRSRLKYSQILITEANYKWLVTPYFGDGILVYDDNGTLDNKSDDRDKYFSIYARNSDGSTEKVSEKVSCLAQDKNGYIWVGCDHGVVFYTNPDDIFENSSTPIASRIYIPRNDGTDYIDYLLGEETVQAIAVDGGNRKWIGSASSGLYLVSADGVDVIHHFTVDNSPLMSNNIKAIAINHNTGEVYIGSEKGLVSFQSDATQPNASFGDVKVYPNPVRDNYLGDITITGLVDETTVKITDVSGNLVNQIESNGGTATWDGNNFYGERVSTGVYLIFCADKAGVQSKMTKVMVVN